MGTMSLQRIQTEFANEKMLLRKPNEKVIEEYSHLLKEGVKLPAIRLGVYPETNQDGKQCILDGTHTFFAAKLAGLSDYEVEIEKFSTAADALARMVELNSARGLPIATGDRNKRIKLLKDRGYTLEAIGSIFKLTKASISRIVANLQGEGPPGPKIGSKKAPALIKPLGAKAFFATLEKIMVTLKHKKSIKDIQDSMYPEGAEHADKKLVKLIGDAYNYMQAFQNAVKKLA